MNPAKRGRVESDESDAPTNWKDYSVCDPCRAKKIRCGRERPHCSNCTRLRQECTWSGQGKKPNQTAALNHAVESLKTRLGRLEDGIFSIQTFLTKLDLDKSSIPASTHLSSQSTTACGSVSDMDSFLSPTISQLPMRHPGRRHVVQTADRCERYLGPTSLQSIMLDVREFVLDPLCDEGLKPQQAAISARDSLNTLVDIGNESELLCHDSPPAMPPLAIMEAMTDPYFELVSPRLPIWTRQGFRRLIEACQASGDKIRDRACAVCSNNMILLTLTAKSLQVESRRCVQSTDKQSLSSMELDLIRPFLLNAKRAVNKLEQLLSPSLANIQAFLSLCSVAQQYLTDDIFNLSFHQAAYLARSIGLDHSQLSAGDPNLDNMLERRNILHCLCIMGTSVSWTTGFRSAFLTAETKATLASTEIHTSKNPDVDWRARLKLAWIEDQVFTLLYSPSLSAKKVSEIRYGISILRQELENWWRECGEEREPEGAESCDMSLTRRSSARIERAISFHSMRILLAWPVSDGYEDSRSMLDDSRSCLKLFIRAWEVEYDLGHYASLSRLLVSYPPVAFIQVLTHVVNNKSNNTGSGNDDLELLQSFVYMVQTVAELGGPKSYMARLDVLARTLTNFAAAYKPTPSPAQVASRPGSWHNNSCSSVDAPLSHITVSATEQSVKIYQELEPIDSFNMHSELPPSNPPFLFNLADISDDFFVGEFARDDG